MSSIQFAGKFVAIPVTDKKQPGTNIMSRQELEDHVSKVAFATKTYEPPRITYFTKGDTWTFAEDGTKSLAKKAENPEISAYAHVTFESPEPKTTDAADQYFIQRAAGKDVGIWRPFKNTEGFQPYFQTYGLAQSPR
jgi:hypothetical protein